MAIYNRFGDECKVIGKSINEEELLVQYADGRNRWRFVGELRADGGVREILDAAESVPAMLPTKEPR